MVGKLTREEIFDYEGLSVFAQYHANSFRGIVFDGAVYQVNQEFDKIYNVLSINLTRFPAEKVYSPLQFPKALNSLERQIYESLIKRDTFIEIPVKIQIQDEIIDNWAKKQGLKKE